MVTIIKSSPLIFTLSPSDVTQSQLSNRMDLGFYDPQIIDSIKIFQRTKFDVKFMEEVSYISRITGFEVDKIVKYVDKGIPFLQVKNVKKFNIDLKDVKKIHFESHRKLKNSQLFPDDVVMTITGRVGDAAVIPPGIKEANCSNQILRIRPFELLDPNYLTVFLNSHLGQSLILQLMSGSTRPRILINNFRKMKIIIPPLVRQRKIVDRIFLLNDQKKNLEKKQNIMEKKIEHTKLMMYKKVNKILGLKYSPHDKKIFLSKPDEFDLRMDVLYFKDKDAFSIKSKYLICRLGDLAEFSDEKIAPKNKPYQKFKYIEISNVDAKTGKISGFKEFLGKDSPSRATQIIHTNDVITSISGSMNIASHVTAIIPKQFDNFITTSGFGILRPKKDVRLKFLFYMLKTPFILHEIKRRLTGAIIPSIRKDVLLDIPIVKPPIKIQELIIDIFQNEETNYYDFINNFNKLEKKITNLENQKNKIFEELLG